MITRSRYLVGPVIAICLAMVFTVVSAFAGDRPVIKISTVREFTEDNAVIARLRMAYAKTGHDITVSRYPLTRSLHAVNTGEEDAILMRIGGLQHHFGNLRRVDQVIAYAHLNIVWHERTKVTPSDFNEVGQGEAGYLQGIILLERLLAGKQAMPVPGADNLIRMLRAGRLQYGFGGGGILKDAAALHADIVSADKPFRQVEMFHYLHKRHQHLIGPLNRALADDPVIPVAD